MRMLRPTLAIILLGLAGTDAMSPSQAVQDAAAATSRPPARTQVSSALPEKCPITKPPAQPFVPPSPYSKDAGAGWFWFGSKKLWTRLPVDGTWKGLPHYRPTDSAFRQKLFWWREGYDWRVENPPKLTVSGKRLDSPAPPFEAEHGNAGWTDDANHPFMVVGVDMPTLGCWAITGDYGGDQVTFVVWVAQ